MAANRLTACSLLYFEPVDPQHAGTTSHLRQEKQLRQLMEMGFSRYQSLVALEKTGGAPVVSDVFPGVKLFGGSSLP